jgi:hypothetical protein
MARSAKVLSIQALKDFRIAMINFVEEARSALGGVDMELKRMRDWLERDQLGYWQMQVKQRHEAMTMARTELHRRKISQQGSDAVSDTEQKEALREAQRRLHAAEQKVEIVKKLIPIFHHAMSEYTARANPLADHLSGGMHRSLGSLEKMVQSLETYLAVRAPTAPRTDFGSSPGPETALAPRGVAATNAEADASSASAEVPAAEVTMTTLREEPSALGKEHVETSS